MTLMAGYWVSRAVRLDPNTQLHSEGGSGCWLGGGKAEFSAGDQFGVKSWRGKLFV